MRVIGHRGAAGHVAENTVGGMRYALELGVDGVEFDVRLIEQRLIVLHDDTLERTTNGQGSYKSMPLGSLRQLQTASGEPIPFLEEVLAVVDSCAVINIEVKEPGIAREVLAAVEDYMSSRALHEDNFLLSSFDFATTTELAALRQNKRLGMLFEGDYAVALARAVELEAYSIHLAMRTVDRATVELAHARQLQVYVYTVNEPHDIATCAACGVDAVFSDYPERVVAHNRRLIGLGD
jgi:glycerophosphoryl diester phosphodiesterase